MKNTLRFFKKITPMLALAVMMMAPILGWGQVQTYQLITSDSQLEAGAKYLVVGIKATSTPETFYAMGLQNTNNRASVSITVASGEIVVEPATLPTDEMPFEVTLGGSSGVWTIFDAVNSTYLRPRTRDNNGLQGQPTSTNANWSIAIGAGGLASMVCENTTTYPRNVLRFNASNNPPLFACYASGQADVYLYRLTPSSSSSIFLSPTDLSGFNYVQGSGPSAEQNFTVSGSDLEADISIAATTNYEISKTSGSGYTTPLIFTQTDGNVAEQTVYVRLKAGLSAGDYDNEVITASSTGATDKTVTVSGTVAAPPPPDAPVAAAATAVTATGFTANWNASAGASGYRLDVYSMSAGTNATDLFISEYGEGSSNNKYIEIFNGTGSSVDLSEYVLKQAYNGGGWSGDPYSSYNLSLTGTLANNDVYVIANSQANQTILDQADLSIVYHVSDPGRKIVSFTGNDAIGLFKNSVLIDVFGDPTSLATIPVAGFSTYGKDHTIVRKSSINAGNTDWTSSSGTNTTDSEWIGYAQDTWTYLGSHTMDGGSTQTYVSGYENLDVGNVTSYAVTTLSSATTYFYVVRATNASGTSGNSNEISVATLASPVTSTYTGTGTWTNASNWSNGLPTGTTDVIINGNVTVDEEVECHDMTISPTGAVTVGADKELYVFNNLLIESNATGTGSFIGAIADYDITGTQTVQRFISGAAEAWHLLSSPVAAQSISGDFTPSGTYGDGSGYDFYAWDEPTETWLNQKVGANNLTAFTPAQGYLVAYQAINPTKTFTGTLNEGIYYPTLTISGTQSYQHSNLLGNPYPSSIDWKNVSGLDKSNLVADGGGYNMYIWNEASVNYGVYNDANSGDAGTNGTSRYIAPMQGFFVIAANADDFGFDNDARVHSTQAWLKSGNDNSFRLSVTAPANTGKDEILLDFGHEASQGGADKWYSMSATAPALYATTVERDYSIRFLTSIADNPLVHVAFKAGIDGEYSIQADFNTAELPSVKLIDHLTGIVHDLISNPTYNFAAATGDDPNRFELKFGAVGIDDNIALEQISIYSHGQSVYISSVKSTQAVISIYNITGQQVYANTMVIDGQKQIALNTPTGWYIVKVRTQEGVATQKVFIKSN